MKNVLYVFDLDVSSDSRCQKEITALNHAGYSVDILEWNKDEDYPLMEKNEIIRGKLTKILSRGIKVLKGKGFKENIGSLIKYEIFVLGFMIKNIKKYDIVHCCNLDAAFVSSVVAKLYSKKVIYDIYDDYADSHQCGKKFHDIIKKIDKFVQKRVDAIIICSDKRMEQLGATKTPVYTIHNSPDVYPDKRENVLKNEDEFRIVYVGNLCNNRMIKELIGIVLKHKNWRLFCGGTGVLEDEIIKLSHSSENVEFLGKMKYEDVVNLESSCDVIPALYDPSLINNTYAAPNKFYEAMFLGKPTIMVKNTGMDEVVLKENTGLVISFNENELEDALESIYQHKKYWIESAERIKDAYAAKYSWECMRDILLGIYRKF